MVEFRLPVLVDLIAAEPTLEFFAAQLRNRNTRVAYWHAISNFLSWCQTQGCGSVQFVRPMHVAAYVQFTIQRTSPQTAKQHLAAIRSFFSWLVQSQVLQPNPATSVRGPSFFRRVGATPVLDSTEIKHLLESIETDTPIGLRDRALIGTMFFALARVSAAVSMNVSDVFMQKRRLWLRLNEKGGKQHEMPCNHRLEELLRDYIEREQLSHGWLFRSCAHGRMGDRSLLAANAYAMVRRRAAAAGITTKIGNHSFRASGITTYLQNGGTLEMAASMANHTSTRTTQLYDRRADVITQSEVERILL